MLIPIGHSDGREARITRGPYEFTDVIDTQWKVQSDKELVVDECEIIDPMRIVHDIVRGTLLHRRIVFQIVHVIILVIPVEDTFVFLEHLVVGGHCDLGEGTQSEQCLKTDCLYVLGDVQLREALTSLEDIATDDRRTLVDGHGCDGCTTLQDSG